MTDLSPFPEPASIPIACLLPPASLTARLSLIETLFAGALAHRELPAGYAFTFPGSDTWLDRISAFIREERACCPFFDFTLRVPPGEPLELIVRGPVGAKAMIAEFLASPAPGGVDPA